VLSDPARRASYDAHGFAGLAGASAEDLWGGIDFAGIFGPGVPGFGGLSERLFGPPEAGPPRGQDLRVDLALPLGQLMGGGKQAVSISRPGPCPECGGSGARPGTTPRSCPDCGGTGQQATASRRGGLLIRQVSTCPGCQGHGLVIDQPCPACHGTGQAIGQDKVTVRIPRGIPDRTALRLAGRGMPSPVPGGPPGDTYVIIRMLPDPRFARDGADLRHTLHIGVPDAALGTVRRCRRPTARRVSRFRPEPNPAPCWPSRARACPLSRPWPGQAQHHRDRGHPGTAQPAAAPALRAAPRGRCPGHGPVRVTEPGTGR
jgi:molecular chaperone DnaJ